MNHMPGAKVGLPRAVELDGGFQDEGTHMLVGFGTSAQGSLNRPLAVYCKGEFQHEGTRMRIGFDTSAQGSLYQPESAQ